MKVGKLNPTELKYNGYVVHDIHEVTSPETSFSFTGLDGDVDEEYILEGNFKDNSVVAGNAIFVKINSLTSNWAYQALQGTASILNASVSSSLLNLANAWSGKSCPFELRIRAKTGNIRTALSKYHQNISGTTVTGTAITGWSWSDTTTNITSLLVECNKALGIGIGSKFTLWKKSKAGV